MFVGEYQYKVDEKGRIPVPPVFRHEFADGGFMTQGAEDCIAVYTVNRFNEIARSLQTNGLPGSDVRKISRALFSKALEVKLDGQGRISLSPQLRQYAKVDDNAIVVGANTYFEIWSPERWQAQASQDQSAWQIIEKLEQKGQQEC
ncbi:MAG: division/cell wall cluster transcriptional repressor MraZ [Chloroflexi bacterium]|nr:division/cell wall cluster transcriptional repressor MraZ [Chloroflexota bacterium]